MSEHAGYHHPTKAFRCHLLMGTTQQSGLTCGKGFGHVSAPLLTTQVTHTAILDVLTYWCLSHGHHIHTMMAVR